MFDDKNGIFGFCPDMNGDGKHDFADYLIYRDLMEKEASEDKPRRFDTQTTMSKEDIQSKYGIDSEEFNSREDYLQAINDVSLDFIGDDDIDDDIDFECDDIFDENDSISLGVSDDDIYDGLEYDLASEADDDGRGEMYSVSLEFVSPNDCDEIKESDYPNKRTYTTAWMLSFLKNDELYIPSDMTKEEEEKLLRFILSQSCIAARYLSCYNGFLYVQAVKENFSLPISAEDEDNIAENTFSTFFTELVEEDTELALDVWAWCIKEFGAYQCYMNEKHALYSHVTLSYDDYPDEFRQRLIDRLGDDPSFCRGLFAESPDIPLGTSEIIIVALQSGKEKAARMIFVGSLINQNAMSKTKTDLLENIICNASNWEELETMEAIQKSILPLARESNNKRINRMLPKLEKKVDDYIKSVELSAEKYRYSRRFSWRAAYKECDTDPLKYETEDEYLAAVKEGNYGWREHVAPSKLLFADPLDYETSEEFNKAVRTACCGKLRTDTRKEAANDNRVYKFCKVKTELEPNRCYYYFPGALSLCLGDEVIVPFGQDDQEIHGSVVSIGECYRNALPCSPDSIKYIKRKQN